MAPVGSDGRDDAAVTVSNPVAPPNPAPVQAAAPQSAPVFPPLAGAGADADVGAGAVSSNLEAVTNTTLNSTPVAAPASHPPEQIEEQPRQQEQQRLSPLQNGNGEVLEPKTASESDSSMSNHRPPVSALHGLPTGYSTGSPSPGYAHPATSLPTTQYASYPAVTATGSANDSYRVSPVGTAPMSLPSMRTIDPMSQQSGPLPMSHHSMSMSMNGPLTTASATPTYYASHSIPLPSNYGIPQDALARYPLPHDPRLVGHRGPKKEIKRRTKTGCLTCRKRRIKCDETHPTCNNCKKSKRDCLGYDPIFRQQAGNQTSNTIQSTQGVLPPSTPTSTTSSASPTAAVGQSPVPRLANSYGSQPSMLPSVYSASSNPHQASITNSAAPPASGGYHSSLPTVPAPPPTSITPESHYSYPLGVDHASHQASSGGAVNSGPSHFEQKPASGPDNNYLRAQKMKISDIINLLGPPAPAQQISHTEETFNEITKVYHEMYAGSLSNFFETNWYYFTEDSKMTFPKDANLIEHMATFLKILEAVKANDHSQMAYSGVLETRIVWELACTAYQIPERTNAMRLNLPPDNDPTEARNRLQVVEALLCGDYLSSNPLSPPVADADHHRSRQFDFWYSLAEFVRKREEPNAPATVRIREDVLTRMRHLLDGRENRDVLYSIAVVRELAPNFESGYANTMPQHLDESDPKNRLAVASKFILDESQVTGGTTNVVRRFSDIATRAFVNPGVNIARRV